MLKLPIGCAETMPGTMSNISRSAVRSFFIQEQLRTPPQIGWKNKKISHGLRGSNPRNLWLISPLYSMVGLVLVENALDFFDVLRPGECQHQQNTGMGGQHSFDGHRRQRVTDGRRADLITGRKRCCDDHTV